METDETESHSVITEGNSLYPALTYPRYSNSFSRSSQNHPIARFSSPVNPPGEALNDFSRVALDDSDEFYRMQPGKNTRNFSSYPQISNVEGSSRFMGNIPLSSALMNTYQAERFSSIDDQEKLASLGTFECLFGYTETRVADNSSDVASSSFGTMLPGYEGLSFDTGGRLDFSKILSPQELVGNGGMEVPSVEPTGTYVPNEWAIIEQGGLNSSSPGSSRFSNELSLSLATSQPSGLLDQCSEMSSSGVTSYSFHNSQIVSERGSCSTSKNVSLSSSSYRPLQPATLFLGSRFMQAMQEILAEIGGYALENVEDGVKVSFSRLPDDSSKGLEEEEDDNVSLFQERDEEAKKKHLLTLLQLVDDRYNQCLDEIHTVTSAFHAVTELDPNLHARFALATISFMYKNLKERISSHILAVGAHHNEGETSEDKSFETSFLQKQWALQQLSKRDHHFWRPQRGLPERSVSILRAWMFQNFLHPYPKDAEKHLLAVQSGLTRNQVSNWFINARVRLWKPMIEEMCAEMNKQKPRRNSKETEGNYRNINCFDTRRFTMD